MRYSLWGMFVAAFAVVYLGPFMHWWARPTAMDLLFIVLLFIVYVLVEIAVSLERIAPKKETKEERELRMAEERYAKGTVQRMRKL
jgi:uncharacterized membrane protein